MSSSGLVLNLAKKHFLKTPAIISAFTDIARADFVPEEFEEEAEIDMCLPIGCGQVISQPSTVAIMLELLDPRHGQTILDIGSGSGWTSALLGHIVQTEGKVVSFEHLPELHALGKKNIEKFGLIHAGIVECVLGDGTLGYEKYAPYDRILVSTTFDQVPSVLKKQLKVGGKMVFALHNHICYLEKKSEVDYYKEEFSGLSFIPLVQKSL